MNVLLNDEIIKFLQVRRLPGRLTVPQTAALLGFLPHDIAVLIKKKLLRPLGKPLANATRYFAAHDIERLSSDSAWLSKATQIMYEHWQRGRSGSTDSNDKAS
ncbi:MAG TPA: hypothetical protein VL981_05080 [Candidatus Methylacidiphilales bacterium]|nr:hypothetical protein [Candidatus Methylacidiphilales bacterium]